MKGAESVVALVMLEWATGVVATAAWNQSWGVVRRGHFRIVAWCALGLVGIACALLGDAGGAARAAAAATLLLVLLFLLMQYVRTEALGVAAGTLAGLAGAVALVAAAARLDGWTAALAGASLLTGAAFLGGVTNGMLLGHWYLNQPGLKPGALARLTDLTLAATAASVVAGLVAARTLMDASTGGAALVLTRPGESFAGVFYVIWLALTVTTGIVVWAARRCVQIRSIQSATGLFYVALLTAGVAEFLVRYLMVNAS